MKVRDRLSEGFGRERIRLEMRRASWPVATLIAAIVVAVGCITYIVAQLDIPWFGERTLTLEVVVPDAAGVVPGQHDVRVSGVAAGKIVSAERDPRGARLGISLDAEFAPVYRDAQLKLRPQSQLQDMYLDIESRGTISAGELRSGDTLTVAAGDVAVHVNQVLDTFQPSTRARLTQLLRSAGDGLADNGRALREAFVQLTPFLGSAARLTSETAERRQVTRRLVHNARLVFEELASREAALTALIDQGEPVLQDIAEGRQQLAAVLQELPPTLSQADASFSQLASALDSVDPALTALRQPGRELESGLRSLEDLSDAARRPLRALRPGIRELAPVADELIPLSDNVARSFGVLRPQADSIDLATSDIAGCQLAVQKFFQNTLSVFKFGDAHGAYPRGSSTFGIGNTAVRDPNLIRGESCARRGRPR